MNSVRGHPGSTANEAYPEVLFYCGQRFHCRIITPFEPLAIVFSYIIGGAQTQCRSLLQEGRVLHSDNLTEIR